MWRLVIGMESNTKQTLSGPLLIGMYVLRSTEHESSFNCMQTLISIGLAGEYSLIKAVSSPQRMQLCLLNR